MVNIRFYYTHSNEIHCTGKYLEELNTLYVLVYIHPRPHKKVVDGTYLISHRFDIMCDVIGSLTPVVIPYHHETSSYVTGLH